MKRVLYILLMLAMPLVVLPGCRNFEDDVFDKSSSERVQELIDAAYETFTSTGDGWYFSDFPGWEANYRIGGHWIWCKFNANYTVEAVAEFDINFPDDANGDGREDETDIIEYPSGSKFTSGFSLLRGRGAVLSFNEFNDVLHYFSTPSVDSPNGMEGDYEFSVIDVKQDIITVKGIKTGTTMYFHRKGAGTTVEEDFNRTKAFVGKMTACPGYRLEVRGAMTEEEVYALRAAEAEVTGNAPIVTRNSRAFNFTYSVKHSDTDIENLSKQVLLLPSITEENYYTLGAPVEVNGNVITGFTTSSITDPEYGELIVLTSNDADQSVKIIQEFRINRVFASGLWYLDTADDVVPGRDDFSASFLSDWTAAKNAINSSYDLILQVAALGNTTTLLPPEEGFKSPSFIFITDQYVGQYLYDFKPDINTNNELSFDLVGNGLNGAPFYSAFGPLVQKLQSKSPFVLETDHEKTPTYAIFKSKADPAYFFTVTVD